MDIGLQKLYRRIQLAPAITTFLPEEIGKMEGSDVMSSFEIRECSVSGSITGGGAHVDAVVGDPTCAVSIDCDGGMEIGQEAEPAA